MLWCVLRSKSFIGKKIILLSGYQRYAQIGSKRGKLGSSKIQEMRKLRQPASKNPDAVATAKHSFVRRCSPRLAPRADFNFSQKSAFAI